MTAQELTCIRDLRAKRAKLHERRAEVRAARGLPSTALTGMPKPHGELNRRTEKIAAQLADLDAAIFDKDREILRAEINIQRFINSVPDSRMRLILGYRCIDGFSWADVARKISRMETPEAVKAAFLRFVAALEQKPT